MRTRSKYYEVTLNNFPQPSEISSFRAVISVVSPCDLAAALSANFSLAFRRFSAISASVKGLSKTCYQIRAVNLETSMNIQQNYFTA